MKIKSIIVCVIYVLLAILGMTFIKKGNVAGSLDFSGLKSNINIKFLLGISFYGLSFFVYTFVLSKMQVSLMVPLVSGINSVGMVLVGMIFFREEVSFQQMIGAFFVVVGIVMLSINKKF